jgi:BirA family biotin operon repressor/biotin-[acetyl-CoA-carboxylase] ligase
MNRLDAVRIREPIGTALGPHLESLEVFAELDSTNSYLLAQATPPPGRFRVALAENQTAGRGRMGRRWESPPSSGICLSMSYTFRNASRSLSALTLAIGVGLAELIEELGVRGIGLKWPNDLILRNGKLGGILVEMRHGSAAPPTVVVGLGLNVDLHGEDSAKVPPSRLGPVIDLASCTEDLPSRSSLSARLIERLFNTLAEFDADGFERFHAAWPAYDWLRGQNICVESESGEDTGMCQGIDSDGALILHNIDGRKRILSGSIYLAGQAGSIGS